jgi:hypothetical protein
VTSATVETSGPPIPLFIATLVGVGLALDGSSRESLFTVLLAGVVSLGVLIVWLPRFLSAVGRARGRLTASKWAGWLAIPLLIGTVFAVSLTEGPSDARLSMSRGALDAMAADVLAGGSTDRGWVGLYAVGRVDLTENGLRFVVNDSTLGRWGFAYSTSGEPVFIDDEEEQAGLWTGAWFDSVGAGWFRWTQEWD